MARDTTIAPRERINIVYKPATSESSEQVELPLKLLVIGDFVQQSAAPPLEERRVIGINKVNFDDVMAGMDNKLAFAVRDVLRAGTDGDIPIHLGIESMRDFSPQRVAEQVPELRQLLELRMALTALKGPMGNVPAFRRMLQAIVENETSRNAVLQELQAGETAITPQTDAREESV